MNRKQSLSLRELLLGKPKNPLDPRVFHQISLIAFLAWVGLGADGLSSSAYGPEEAYLALGQHFFLALPLAIMTAVTVFVISTSYSQIIELFPTGGGGYLVATKLLGAKAGLVSGSALVVDLHADDHDFGCQRRRCALQFPAGSGPRSQIIHGDHPRLGTHISQPPRHQRIRAVFAPHLSFCLYSPTSSPSA